LVALFEDDGYRFRIFWRRCEWACKTPGGHANALNRRLGYPHPINALRLFRARARPLTAVGPAHCAGLFDGAGRRLCGRAVHVSRVADSSSGSSDPVLVESARFRAPHSLKSLLFPFVCIHHLGNRSDAVPNDFISVDFLKGIAGGVRAWVVNNFSEKALDRISSISVQHVRLAQLARRKFAQKSLSEACSFARTPEDFPQAAKVKRLRQELVKGALAGWSK
jgi:hypothetical protein